MSEFHVQVGEISGVIYAGTFTMDGQKWSKRTDVTEEAIAAVRDYFVRKAQSNDVNSYFYQWHRKDGKTVELRVSIKDDEERANDYKDLEFFK